MFFAADDGVNGPALWRSNGTRRGTRLVKDTWPGSASHGGPVLLAVLGDRLILAAPSAGRGVELWRSDGTTAGTVPLADLVPGPGSAVIFDVVVVGSRLYFVAAAGQSGQELWVTDGTAPGTKALTKFTPAAAFFSDTLYLDLPPGGYGVLGNRYVFAAHDGTHGVEPWVGTALWTSDGTAAGTRRVHAITPERSEYRLQELIAFKGRAFFPARGGLEEEGLWASDGTAAGTVLVRAFGGFYGPQPSLLTEHGGALYFFADDGERGNELWKSDGTPAGTVLAADLVAGAESFAAENMVSAGDKLFISGGALFENGGGLWVSDGTTAGTRQISPVRIARNPFAEATPVVFQGELYYGAGDSAANGFIEELWKSDGTEAGTGPLHDRDGNRVVQPRSFVALGDQLLFTSSRTDVPLWQTDGTEAGTFVLRELAPGYNPITRLVRVGSRVFFPSFDRVTGYELWAVAAE